MMSSVNSKAEVLVVAVVEEMAQHQPLTLVEKSLIRCRTLRRANYIWNFIQEILNDKNSYEESYRNKLPFIFKLFAKANCQLFKMYALH